MSEEKLFIISTHQVHDVEKLIDRVVILDEGNIVINTSMETVMTTLHAGGKFGGGAYKVTGGLHGVGGSVVNGLSEHLRAEVCRQGWRYYQLYAQGIPTTELVKDEKTQDHGTRISFRPDPAIFPEIDYDKVDAVRGLDITITTTAKNDEQGRCLLTHMGLPLRK